MLAWLVVLVLVGAEVGLLSWWLRKEYYRLFFKGWAALLYSAVLAGDFVVGWLVSTLEKPGGTFGMQLVAGIGIFQFVVVVIGNLFLRWVVAHDMTDIPNSKK